MCGRFFAKNLYGGSHGFNSGIAVAWYRGCLVSRYRGVLFLIGSFCATMDGYQK
jgi:hypothetical protein